MICEGCIKQSTCKYKDVVEEYEADAPEMSFDEPLEATVICKYKQTCVPYPPNCTIDCDTTTYIPDDNVPWTYTV